MGVASDILGYTVSKQTAGLLDFIAFGPPPRFLQSFLSLRFNKSPTLGHEKSFVAVVSRIVQDSHNITVSCCCPWFSPDVEC